MFDVLDSVIDGGGLGKLRFQIVQRHEGGGQCHGYKAKTISDSDNSAQYAFIKNYDKIDLKMMPLVDLFFQKIASRIPTADQIRISLPLNDSKKEGKYRTAIGEAGNAIFVAYRWIEGETLKNWLIRGKHSDDEKMRIILAVLHVCSALTKAKIAHLDLKPDNLMINKYNGREYLTLIDMDLARIKNDDNDIYAGLKELIVGFDKGSSKKDADEIKIGGTQGYASPEQFEDDITKITDRADVFSLSILLSQILLEYHPYKGCSIYYEAICSSSFSLPDKGYHPNIMTLISRGLNPEPMSRPTMAEIINTFHRYKATSFRKQRCGIVISNGRDKYNYWETQDLAGQDLRGFGIPLPAKSSIRLKIDQDKGEYGIQLLDKSLAVRFNMKVMTPGKTYWLNPKSTLHIGEKKLTLIVEQE